MPNSLVVVSVPLSPRLFWTVLGFRDRAADRAGRAGPADRAGGRLGRAQRGGPAGSASGRLLPRPRGHRLRHCAAPAAWSRCVCSVRPKIRLSARSGLGLCRRAALLALAPAAAIMPKVAGDGGLPRRPHLRPRQGRADRRDGAARAAARQSRSSPRANSRFVYYYLWHFSAAEVARLLGVTGWEADAAMTWFSAFASLAAMMGFAVLAQQAGMGGRAGGRSRRDCIEPLPAPPSVRCAERGGAIVAARRFRRLAVPVGMGAAAHHVGHVGRRRDLLDGAAGASAKCLWRRHARSCSRSPASRARPGSAVSLSRPPRLWRCRCS